VILAFLTTVATAHPRVQLHVVADNYATHNHPNVKAWLAKHARITMHFTPTSEPNRSRRGDSVITQCHESHLRA
jgi:hypothetical protein